MGKGRSSPDRVGVFLEKGIEELGPHPDLDPAANGSPRLDLGIRKVNIGDGADRDSQPLEAVIDEIREVYR